MLAILTIALLTLLPVAAATAVPTTPAGPAARGTSPTPDEEGGDGATTRVSITSITPMVGRGDEAVVHGRVTNTGDEDISSTTVSLIPKEPDSSSDGVREWSRGDDPITGTVLAETTLEDIPAGGEATFALAVPGNDLAPDTTAGAAWVSVQTSDTAVHTFIGIHRAKEYVPMKVVWGVPLVLPAERRLFQETGEERTDAWRELVGPESRLAALTAQPPARDEAWLLDPTLLQAPPDTPTGLPEGEGGAADTEQEIRGERADAIRETLVGDRTIVLPRADADTAVGAASERARRLVSPQVEAGASVAERLGAHGNVVWPADGNASGDRSRGYNRLYPGSARPTVLANDTSFRPSGFTPTGAANTDGGTPVIVRDSDLSQLAGSVQNTSNASLTRQRLIAGTAALLQERAGTERTIFVVPDREATPDAAAYARLRDRADDIPWLRSGDVGDLLDSARSATETYSPRTTGQQASADVAGPDAVLDSFRATDIVAQRRELATFATVRVDGEQWRRWMTPNLMQLTSTRWRSAPEDLDSLHEEIAAEVTLTEEELVVSSGDVNFFADTGRLQITVINKTDVELTNLEVRLQPDNPSLRIDDPPETLTIGPNGRQTVTVRASALAAARVPVDVTVLSPRGQDLTAPASLHVSVRPTGDVVYWIIGGAAALLLGAGTWRTVRGGRRAKGATTDQESPEENG